MSEAPRALLTHHLEALRLPTFPREHDKLARQCAAEGVAHTGYLLRLAEPELLDRERRMVERRIRQARFPAVKSLDGFDFAAIPALNKMLVLELARGEYVQVLRLLETFRPEDVHAAVREALRLGAIGYDAVKHLVLCRIERRPPKLDLADYPYLPRVTVATTSAGACMALLGGNAG